MHLPAPPPTTEQNAVGIGVLDIAAHLLEHRRSLLLAPLLAGTLALGLSYLVPPTFTAKTTFLPPQQQGGSASAALASLGALAGLAGGGVKTTADQYVSLMQSVNIEDRIVDKFGLIAAYKAKLRFEAREALERNTKVTLGKKDGLITVEVEALTPELSAAIANQYVEELRRLSSELALTDAQQRRAFFEKEVKRTKERLAAAQEALQSGGFNASALKAEPKAAADAYAKLKAEVTSAEVRLQTLRRALTDSAPEIQQQATMLSALRGQLGQLERATQQEPDAGYVGRYREYKYQETLYELFSRQYEAARVDESRDGTLLQVVDAATPAEHKSKPKRLMLAIGAAVGAGLALCLWLSGRFIWFEFAANPSNADQVGRLRRAWRKP